MLFSTAVDSDIHYQSATDAIRGIREHGESMDGIYRLIGFVTMITVVQTEHL